jgi:hypothetical protein
MRLRAQSLLIGMVALLGCYHATIDTGVAPSNRVIEKKWASGWIFGLVPPSPTATAAQCPSGVARVETKLSFLNQVVSFLTLSIYTPMAIRVTCAEGVDTPAAAMLGPDSASSGAGPAGLMNEVDRSAAPVVPVAVQITE